MKNIKKGGIVALVLLIAYGVYDFLVYTGKKTDEDEEFWGSEDFNLGDYVTSECTEGQMEGREIIGYLYKITQYAHWIGAKHQPRTVYRCDKKTTKKVKL